MVVGAGSQVTTTLAVLPCTQDFALSNPTDISIDFFIIDELDISYSASTAGACWLTFDLSLFPKIATPFAQTFISSPHGTAIVAEEVHSAPGGSVASLGIVPHPDTTSNGSDLVTLPPGLVPGF